jgi:hypothetical protein
MAGAGAARRAATLLLLLACLNAASAKSHHFKDGEEVELYANKVGPFSNPRCASLARRRAAAHARASSK